MSWKENIKIIFDESREKTKEEKQESVKGEAKNKED